MANMKSESGGKGRLNLYGENGFTYLFFHRLLQEGKVVDFLRNLKRFDNGKKPAEQKAELFEGTSSANEPDIWLFPNFGKRDGFGEPDALILWGGHSFWIEVETEFDLKKGKASADRAMLQLIRFYHLGKALEATKIESQEVLGPTIKSNGQRRQGKVKIASHAALCETRERIATSVKDNKCHLVILSIHDAQLSVEELAALAHMKSQPISGVKGPSASQFWLAELPKFNDDAAIRRAHQVELRYVHRKGK
jgi:hypothetical protein